VEGSLGEIRSVRNNVANKRQMKTNAENKTVSPMPPSVIKCPINEGFVDTRKLPLGIYTIEKITRRYVYFVETDYFVNKARPINKSLCKTVLKYKTTISVVPNVLYNGALETYAVIEEPVTWVRPLDSLEFLTLQEADGRS
jgi:hypothetical protein